MPRWSTPAKRAKTDQVFFGATVTYANAKGEERTIKIVGVDEVDLDKGHVSWISPIAKALLRAEEGDVVQAAHAGRRGRDRDRESDVHLALTSSAPAALPAGPAHALALGSRRVA